MSDHKRTIFGHAALPLQGKPTTAEPSVQSPPEQPNSAGPGGAPLSPQEQYASPAGQHPPVVGQYASPAGQYAPSAGQYPPATGQYAPPAGQYPPAAGQYAPPAGQYPPAPSNQQHPQSGGNYPSAQYAQIPGQSMPPEQAHGGNYAQPAHNPYEQLAPVRRVSKGLYLSLYLGGIVLGGGLMGWGISDRAVQELIPFSVLPMLVGMISYYVLLYKSWNCIQDGYTYTTAGKAVGYSFIPLFNIYWLFVAMGRWPKEFNAFCHRNGRNGFRASEGLFTAHCVLLMVFGIVSMLITMPMCIAQMCDGINSTESGNLPQAQAQFTR